MTDTQLSRFTWIPHWPKDHRTDEMGTMCCRVSRRPGRDAAAA